MKGLFALLILLPSIGLCSKVIVTPNLPSQPTAHEFVTPNVHRPNQHPIINVPGVAAGSQDQRVIIVRKSKKRHHAKAPKVIMNPYANNRSPAYNIHTPR